MTNKNNESNELELDKTLAETTHKVEDFYNANKKGINYAVIAIIAILGGYIGFTQLYLKPLEEEAQREIFRAQQYFANDSFQLAINGNDAFKGFEDLSSEYGMTKAGNLAHYYAGVSYLRLGQFENAIDHLSEFSTENELIGVLAKGALGDAYSESGDTDKALSYYLKAAKMSKNKLTSPLFYKKAAIVYESQSKYSDALDIYETIKKDFNESTEAGDIDKYIARAKSMQESN
jgi:tetratricopeptide (TPR) repeat protein